MGKKPTNNQNGIIASELQIEKSEFKDFLNKRISDGEEIFNRKIQTNQDFDKLKEDFSFWTDFNSEYLKQAFNNPANEYKRSYDSAYAMLFSRENRNPLDDKKIDIKLKIDNLKKLVGKIDILKSISSSPILNSDKVSANISKKEVFIVHGHDNTAQVKAARFIEKLGLKPIILHEQSSSGKTIIEKIEEYSNVGFGIVLYTPCDIGSKQTEPPILKARARQNVVFEHGYLIGKIGRNNVCALVKGDIETPNDISGVVYVNMDESDAWHVKIAKELKSSGYNIDLNKIIE